MYSIFASVIAPTLPPSNVVLMRSHDGTSMIITWDPITLETSAWILPISYYTLC